MLSESEVTKLKKKFDEAENEPDIYDAQFEYIQTRQKRMKEMLRYRSPRSQKEVILRLLEMFDVAYSLLSEEDRAELVECAKKSFRHKIYPEYMQNIMRFVEEAEKEDEEYYSHCPQPDGL